MKAFFFFINSFLVITFLGISFFLLNQPLYALPKDYLLVDLEERPFPFDHKKNKELVVFWATWCGDCKGKLTGDLLEFNKRADVAVITISLDSNVPRLKHFIQKHQIQLPVLRDPEKKLIKTLNVFAVPHWAIYKRQAENKDWQLVESSLSFNSQKIEMALK